MPRALGDVLVLVWLALSFAMPTSAVAACGDGTVNANEACDDGNTRGGDCCSANCLIPSPNGTPCSDRLFCTTSDQCQSGVCVGAITPCKDDALSCTVTTCDEGADVCRHIPDHALCDDGVFCNGREVCDAISGAGCRPPVGPVDCSASSTACRIGVCDEALRACITVPRGDEAVCDRDGDGLSVEEDGCPHTPEGARVLAHGCAPADLVRRPHILLDPVLSAVTSAGELLRNSGLDTLARKVERLAHKADKARDGIAKGTICKGAEQADNVVRGLDEIRRRLSWKLDRKAHAARRDTATSGGSGGVPDDEGDHRNVDGELDRLASVGDVFADHVEDGQTARSDVEALCAAVVGPLEANGTIDSVDDTSGVIVLEDGVTVVFTPGGYKSETFPITGRKSHVAPGITATLKGVRFDDGTGVVTDIVPVLPAIPDAKVSPFACLELLVAPFQRFLDVPVEEMTLLPRAGYENLAKTKYIFEDRMWLGAAPTGTCGGDGGPTGSYVRRSFRLVVRQQANAFVMALDLAPGEVAPFPAGIDPSADATLEVTARAQDCHVLSGCASAFIQLSDVAKLPIRVAETGTFCTAHYDTTEFALEDADFVIGQTTPFAQFQPAKVVDISDAFFSVDPGTTPSFHAEAYRVTGTGSSYPMPEPIGLNDEFAIFQNHDFFWNYDVLAYELTGVSTAVGLQWPYAVGVRHGSPVRYACDTPLALVRDLLDVCSSGANSYYRLPFYPGTPFWTMGQGNNGEFTHNGEQEFAFDFLAASGTTVRAARGGTVLKVKQDLHSLSNCYLPFTDPKCRASNNFVEPNAGCTANRARIRHQDGTVGHYIHIPMNGATVHEGERVRRAQPIAIVGNTGCSSDPHLHFHVTAHGATSQTIAANFQMLSDTCVVPRAGDLLLSNNVAP